MLYYEMIMNIDVVCLVLVLPVKYFIIECDIINAYKLTISMLLFNFSTLRIDTLTAMVYYHKSTL